MVLPDKFKCVITNWDYIYDLCRHVSNDIKHSGYQPDTIIALARGGWFAGRVLCDFLGLNDLTSLKIEHYVGTANAGSGPSIKYPLSDNAVAGKKVLIVDDITDTGKSISHAKEYVLKQRPAEVRTAVLQYLYTSEIKPDYCGEILQDWGWIVYPWNFIEDMIDIISRLMAKEKLEDWTVAEIRTGLMKYHNLDPINFEIAQPDRMEEILSEMVRRGIIKTKSLQGERTWEYEGA
ncbi:MAG: phosphoribosyltransferase [Candidatus Methanoperedens sp.]|nr:phosphoribosyltransferase [Candidatus Methanoperedens sp.]MCE8425713.1 phosphoribosyltransferase [Candidatus Methanoperedens sp.]MCE8428189.1 phosphoribosyltransferase [Candidatus Methanoperedens sp.]